MYAYGQPMQTPQVLGSNPRGRTHTHLNPGREGNGSAGATDAGTAERARDAGSAAKARGRGRRARSVGCHYQRQSQARRLEGSGQLEAPTLKAQASSTCWAEESGCA